MYRVTIAAVDMGTPSLQGSAVVEVNVVNIDESPPQFVSPCYRELEETPVAQGDPLLVLVCRAEDYDDGRVTGFRVSGRVGVCVGVSCVSNGVSGCVRCHMWVCHTVSYGVSGCVRCHMWVCHTVSYGVSGCVRCHMWVCHTVSYGVSGCVRCHMWVCHTVSYGVCVCQMPHVGVSYCILWCVCVCQMPHVGVSYCILWCVCVCQMPHVGVSYTVLTTSIHTSCLQVNYELVSVNGRTTELNHPFSSVIRNGQLLATRDLDFEAESNWTLLISATDPSGNKAYTYAYVIILDVNDNAPMFTNPPFEAVYAAVDSTLIFKLEAEDLDTGLNGLFEIYLADPPFTKREDSEIYDVMVNATDFGTPRLTGSVMLQVTLRVVPCSLVDFFLDYTPNDTHAFVYIRTLCAVQVEPIQADLVLGQNHTFQCFAQGNTDITYQWIHNGSAITEVSNSGELVLTDIAFENAGHYACVAISTLGSIQTETVNAIVLGTSVRPCVFGVVATCGGPCLNMFLLLQLPLSS